MLRWLGAFALLSGLSFPQAMGCFPKETVTDPRDRVTKKEYDEANPKAWPDFIRRTKPIEIGTRSKDAISTAARFAAAWVSGRSPARNSALTPLAAERSE